jgi:hypothetical protein
MISKKGCDILVNYWERAIALRGSWLNIKSASGSYKTS